MPWWSKLRISEIFSCKTPADQPILHDTKVHVDLGFFAAPLLFSGGQKGPNTAGLSGDGLSASYPASTSMENGDLYPDVVQVRKRTAFK